MESRKVLKELYIGIAIHACAFLLIGMFFMRPFWIYALALMVGALGACLHAYGIYDTLDRALELPEKNARSFATTRCIVRLLLCMALMVGGILIHWSAFVGITVGLLGLKISAFFNPLLKKFLTKLERVDNTLDIEKN